MGREWVAILGSGGDVCKYVARELTAKLLGSHWECCEKLQWTGPIQGVTGLGVRAWLSCVLFISKHIEIACIWETGLDRDWLEWVNVILLQPGKSSRESTDTALNPAATTAPVVSSAAWAVPHPRLSAWLQTLGQSLSASYSGIAGLFDRFVIYIPSLALEGKAVERRDHNFQWPVLKKAQPPQWNQRVQNPRGNSSWLKIGRAPHAARCVPPEAVPSTQPTLRPACPLLF